MSTRQPALSDRCHARLHPSQRLRPEVVFQRQRQSKDRLNNSPRRTYDLLRSALLTADMSMPLVEEELTDALSASRSTVRAVLQQLAREGLVTREPKNGTRATGSLLLPINELKPVVQLAIEPYSQVETRTLECRSIGCPPMVRDRLRLPVGLTVLMIENLMVQDGLPLGLSVGYIAIGEEHTAAFEADGQDVISILEDRLGIRIGAAHTTVGAVAADQQTAELLGIDVGAPLVFLEDLIADRDGQPRALSQLRLRGDRVVFSATARRSA